MMGSARAQPPSPAAPPPPALPINNAPVGHIPEKPPQYWTAEGGTQAQWTAIRERCRTIVSEMNRRGRLSAEQRSALPPSGFSYRDFVECADLSLGFRPPDVAP